LCVSTFHQHVVQRLARAVEAAVAGHEALDPVALHHRGVVE
jgi:hypothetical protein